MIRFLLFGSIDLRDPAGAEIRSILAQPKRTALLAYLAAAVPYGWQRRDTLLALFWPERDEERARGALNKALHHLRSGLGEDAIESRGSEELRLQPQRVWCDVVAFDEHVEAGEPEQALELYRSDLMEGFHLGGVPEVERWLDSERGRLRLLARSAALSAAEAAEARGDLATAVEYARRAAGLAWTDEVGLRRLVGLMDRAGDRAGALAAYQGFVDRLSEELEAEPAPETRALIDDVRARDRPRAADPDPRQRPSIFDGPGPPSSVASAAEPSGTEREQAASRQAPPRRRHRLLRPAVLLSALLLVLSGAAYLAGRSGGSDLAIDASSDPLLDPELLTVATAVFENRTGDTAVDLVAKLAADHISRALLETGRFRVTTPATLYRVHDLLSEHPADPADFVTAFAEATGATTVVHGSVRPAGDSLVAEARITDVATGRLRHVTDPVRLTAGAPETGIGILAERVTAALATVRGETTKRWATAASKPPTFEAYREWVAGIEAHTGSPADLEEALRRFLRAGALDSTFYQPIIWAVWTADFGGRGRVADSVIVELEKVRERLPPLDEAILDLHVARNTGDWQGRYGAALELVRLAPDSEFRYKAASAAMYVNRPEEALAHLARADPDHGWLRDWKPYWTVLANAYHRLERYGEELSVARERRRKFGMWTGEAIAVAALGEVDEVTRVLAERRDSLGPAAFPGELRIADELRAHGHEEAGDALLRRAVAWFGSLPDDERGRLFNRKEFGFTLCRLGRIDEGRALLERLLPRASNWQQKRHFFSDLGICAALAGDRTEALGYERELAELEAAVRREPPPGARGVAPLWVRGSRAGIHAHLGNHKTALELMEPTAVKGGERIWDAIHYAPEFAPLWGHPSYGRLLERVKTPTHRHLMR